jgi:hypothetical protein
MSILYISSGRKDWAGLWKGEQDMVGVRKGSNECLSWFLSYAAKARESLQLYTNVPLNGHSKGHNRDDHHENVDHTPFGQQI